MSDDAPTEPITIPLMPNGKRGTGNFTTNEDKPLYRSALHIKFFLKKAVKPFFVGLIPLALIALVIAGSILLPKLASWITPTSPPTTTWSIGDLPWTAWALTILASLLWMAICAFLIYRSFFEWQHTGIILTWQELALIRPNSRILFLRRQERKAIDTQSITGYDTDAPTKGELYIFRNSITFSVTVSSQEGKNKNPVDHLADVRNPRKLQEALELIRTRNQSL